MSLEQYYAPVPQVDRDQGGHLGAGVLNFPVQDLRNIFKPVEGEGQSRCTIAFITYNVCTTVFNLVFSQIQVFLVIFPTQDSKTFFYIKSRHLEENSKIVQH